MRSFMNKGIILSSLLTLSRASSFELRAFRGHLQISRFPPLHPIRPEEGKEDKRSRKLMERVKHPMIVWPGLLTEMR